MTKNTNFAYSNANFAYIGPRGRILKILTAEGDNFPEKVSGMIIVKLNDDQVKLALDLKAKGLMVGWKDGSIVEFDSSNFSGKLIYGQL